MKKWLETVFNIIFVITILLVLVILITELFAIFRIMFFGMDVGGEYPDTIWWGKTTLKGFSGVKKYFDTFSELFYFIELPIIVVCVIYQIIYFKIIKKRFNNNDVIQDT